MALKDFGSWIERHHQTVTAYLTVVGMLGGILGFLIEYQHKNAMQERQATFTFVDRYYQEPILDAQTVLYQMWANKQNQQELARAQGGDAKNSAISDILQRTKSGQRSLDTLLAFFEGLSACVESRACDPEVACSIFKADASGLDDTYASMFRRWQKNWGGAPNGDVLRFVHRCVS